MISPNTFGLTLIVLAFWILILPILPWEKTWARTLVTGITFGITVRYMIWRVTDTLLPADFATPDGLWILFCFTVEALAVADMCILFMLLSKTSNRTPEADAHEARLRATPADQLPWVDVFIPTYNEEMDVLERTIIGALGIDYPNMVVWVLDDGKRDWLQSFCAAKDVNYVRRETNDHAKAGNINHALGLSSGDYIAVFDADFVPQREFLYRTTGFFEDPAVGCVQTPQHFFNRDPLQANLKISGIWPDEQRLFFDFIMPCRDAWDVAFCCGSCGVLRRAAIEEAGGMPTDSVTEDILATLIMLRKGYITRYLNERLSHGLAPESLEGFFVQRERWCRGGIQTMYLPAGPLGPGLRPLQRLFFFPLHWLVQQPARFFTLLVPIVYLWINMSPLGPVPLEELLSYQLPLFPAYMMAMRWLAPGAYMPILSTATNILTAFRLMPAAISSLIRPFGVPFKVTPKGNQNRSRKYDRAIFLSCIGLIAVTAGGMLINANPETQIIENKAFYPVAIFWGFLNLALLFFVALMSVELPRFRTEERFPFLEAAKCTRYSEQVNCQIRDISRNGARLRFPDTELPAPGTLVTVTVNDIGALPGRISRGDGNEAGVEFGELSVSAAARLARLLTSLEPRDTREARRADRVALNAMVRCITPGGEFDGILADLSMTGARLVFKGGKPPPDGTFMTIDIRHDVGAGEEADRGTSSAKLTARVMRQTEDGAGIHFEGLSDTLTNRLDGLIRHQKMRIRRNDRSAERVLVALPARCAFADKQIPCQFKDISTAGGLLSFTADTMPPEGARVMIELGGVGQLDGRVMRTFGDKAGVRFDHLDEAVRDRLIQRIYTSGIDNSAKIASAATIAGALFKRSFGRT